MEKKICSYETLFAISGNLSEEDYKALCEKFVNLVNDNASDVAVNEWGKRKLAYEIQKMREGFYYFVRFESEATCPAEVERRVRIMENVIRYLCVRQDA